MIQRGAFILLIGASLGQGVAQELPATAPTTAAATATVATAPTVLSTTSVTTAPATAPATSAVVVSATLPATAPATTRADRVDVFFRDFSVLTTRSIFMKTRVTQAVTNPAGMAGATSQPATMRKEDAVVFNGVTEVDGEWVAFMEDTGAGKVSVVRTGDAIALGKIVEITLDGLQYQRADGQKLHIAIGQTLAGGEALPVSARPVNTGSTGGTGGALDILERLRQKRLQQP